MEEENLFDPPPLPFKLPLTIKHYKCDEYILSTKVSYILGGTDMNTGQKIVSKISARGALDNEYDIMSKINHDNIQRPLDFSSEADFDALILPMAIGRDLEFYLRNCISIDEYIVREFMKTLFLTVDFLHQNGIWHRDIKLENIFCETDDSYTDIFLGDFGSAGIFGDQMISEYCGTDDFNAPEIHKKEEYSNKIDMWSLGVVMYICLTGEYPFPSQDDSESRYDLSRILRGEYIDFNVNISKEARNLIRRLLRPNPEGRYSAAQALQHNWFKINLKNPLEDNIKNTTSAIEAQLPITDCEIEGFSPS